MDRLEQTSSNGSEIVMLAGKDHQAISRDPGLDEVDFKVYKGAVNVLIGENGAGKSTLMKVLAGAEPADVRTRPARRSSSGAASTREARESGIGIIFRNSSSFPTCSIAENIFVGREMTRGGIVQHGEQERVTRDLLDRLEQPLDPSALVRDLRIGQRQIVEIAKALLHNVRVLIMDEPTSALTAAETEALFRIIADLKAGRGGDHLHLPQDGGTPHRWGLR